MISAEFPYEKQFQDVNGKQLAYVEVGDGDPIVLLHGNPTSSYLWRNVIPELEGCGRIIVPDLIGHGDSEKLPASDGSDRYSFLVAYEYLSGLLDSLGTNQNVTLVIHDWGSGLGFHWAKNHPDAVKGIAYMEAIVCPVAWDDRQPTLNWPRQIPIEGEPANMVELVNEYGQWMAGSDLPKLFINAEPGSILVGPQREFCRSWPNQQEVTVSGAHFIQEDSPAEIGQAVAGWLGSF
jgi:haloalkane dehalogenase